MTAALEVGGLTVGYGDQTVLHAVDLVVEDGITAVLGVSGCGKSTLLRSIAGFLRPRAGTIRLAGVEVSSPSRSVAPRGRNIGYVPQEGALFPHLDVAHNIAFGLPRALRRRPHERVAEMLELVDLPAALATRYPHHLSGGQQQRVALARALAARPSLVLLDEPFSSLDAGLREETGRAVVDALRATGSAALLVTHDQGEALSLADQVAIMSHGRFLQAAAPRTIYLSPADETVASFLGHAALLPGEVAAGEPFRATCALGSVRVTGHPAPGRVTLALRPEQVQVRPVESGEGVDAEVVDVSFFGHDATVRTRIAGHPDLVIARTPADTLPGPGDHIRLVVTGEVRCFAPGTGS
ncbi:ABC transporter ATP-binding protein [Nocardioides sp.]|uniref:ABC transporter ATP-binding protein n=1 Tax=Nocardioides sp. TaxID=35761 RepID=UPI002604F9DB|nr:ABC transporter ATP-binding protein [Nocardioides sp.]MDI6908675.1 ABC transporter ATP-binding protein [Nocardioides sp.]